ncbi:hypothetical protein KZO85_12780 [Chromohalobacter canadensis]|uniref:hypothetical protein n=1 Tax=Chromohalobacter canadensis TaxID=141389 RepID=UPI0021C0EE4B|nr:hypothetical protein [Chromohalobacter canadensis]MCT8469461.1 hypothetical protein [Chromohalobacter canadensis]MCT8472085.1 hypothetical protein [Chromohalobacter canadensis]MCT8499802.1 hypothetical protein [Chromohalobacter canadensis]
MAQPLEITTESLKATPPTFVTALYMGGMTPADWVTALTLLYLALQIGLLIPHYVRKWKRWRNRDES